MWSRHAVICAMLHLTLSVSVAANEAEQVFQRVSPSVVRLETDEGGAAGIILDEEGNILTNCHVAISPLPFQVRVDAEKGGKRETVVFRRAELVGVHPEHDLAIMKISPAEHGIRLQPATLARQKGRTGQSIFVVGSSRFRDEDPVTKTVVSGLLSAADRVIRGLPLIEISAVVRHGDSGAPVCDRTGRVLALVSAGVGGTDGVNVAVPLHDFDPKAFVGLEKRRANRRECLRLFMAAVSVAASSAGREDEDKRSRTRAKGWIEALRLFERALVHDPTNWRVASEIGELKVMLDDHGAGAAYLVRSIRLNPWGAGEGKRYGALALALAALNRKRDVMTVLDEAVAKYPRGAPALWRHRALASASEEHWAKAVESAAVAIHLLNREGDEEDLRSRRRMSALLKHARRKAGTASSPGLETNVGSVSDHLTDMERTAAVAAGEGREYITPDFAGLVRGFSLRTAQPDGLSASPAAKPPSVPWTVGRLYGLLKVLRGHSGHVRAVAFTPDGKRLVSAGEDETVRIWDLVTGRCTTSLDEHPDPLWCLAVSADGNEAVSGDVDGVLMLWDMAAGKPVTGLQEHSGAVRAVALSADGRHAASAGDSGRLKVKDLGTLCTAKDVIAHRGTVWGLCFDAEGRRLVSGGADDTVKIWNVASGGCIRTLRGHSADVHCVTWSPDNQRIASGSVDGSVRIWNAQTGECLRTLKGHTEAVWSVTFLPDGNSLISAGGDHTIRIWGPTGEESLQVLRDRDARISSVAVTRDGSLMASVSTAGSVRIWRVTDGPADHGPTSVRPDRGSWFGRGPTLSLGPTPHPPQRTLAKEQIEAATKAGVGPAIQIELGGGVTMKMVPIPAGRFVMGSPLGENGRAGDETQHEVRLAKPFYLGVNEVTVGQFRRFVTEESYRTEAEKEGWAYAWNGTTWGKINGISWQKPGFPQKDDYPVACVSHNDAVAFCTWLSGKVTGSARLPTEAKWEYACRAGTKTAYQWGGDPDDGKGWCNGYDLTSKAEHKFPWSHFNWRDGFVFTAPVGSFKPNAWGLYDMHGNVWEWCSDRYGKYDAGVQVDPTGAGGSRVLRGGSWYDDPGICRSASRDRGSPDGRNNVSGFRVTVDVK